MRRTIIAMLAVATASAPALAQDGRYRLERIERGFLRMDTQTGSTELCTENAGALDCRPAAGGSRMPEAQALGALQARVDYLEKRIAALEAGGAKPEASMPSDEEFEQTLGLMERFMRRFMGVAKAFEQEGTNAPAPVPNRT